MDQFDWRVQCRLAAAWQRSHPDSLIYVPSAFQQAGAPSELEYYGDRLRAEGVPGDLLRLDPRGYETVEQCELALALARSEQAKLVAVVCQVQARRVRHLLQEQAVEPIIARGKPNRWLQFTHLVLARVFPVVDHLGMREAWKQQIARRRVQGRQ